MFNSASRAHVINRLIRWVRNRWRRSLVVCLIGGLALAGCIYWFTAGFRTAGHDFLYAVERGDYDQAFVRCSPELQQELGSPARLRIIGEQEGGLHNPQFWWSFSGIGSRAVVSSRPEILGPERFIRLRLENIDGSWRITAIFSRPPNVSLNIGQWR